MTPNSPEAGHRPSDLAENARITREASEALQPINDRLAEFSEDSKADYTGLVLFIPEGRLALPIVSLDGLDIPNYNINDFRRKHVDKRGVLLSATAIGQFFNKNNGKPEYKQSLMNPSDHMTLISPSIIDGKIAGASQVAFDTRRTGLVPNMDKLASILNDGHPVINEFTNSFLNLAKTSETLNYRLEFDPPTTPNAYIIRWDIENSTKLATGHQSTAFMKLLRTIKGKINSLISEYPESISDTGDGQNLVLFITDPNRLSDVAYVSSFGKTKALKLINDIEKIQSDLLRNEYPDLDVTINFSIDLNYIDKDTVKLNLENPPFWITADKLKTKNSEKIQYTDAANQSINLDGAGRTAIKQTR